MKIRHGFVSNSSSCSFLVVGCPPDEVESILLHPATALKIIQYIKQSDYLPSDMPDNLDLDNLFLTQFLRDAGDYTRPLDEAGLTYFDYCSGGHDGPYDAEDFICMQEGDGHYDSVWLLPAHFDERELPPKGTQTEFEFEAKDE